MGGAVSSGQNNDELIDNLKDADYIKTAEVERVFRIVDRAHYYLSECRDSAYKDLAWKNGTLHLSAPCIYSEVMEALELKKEMSFLNLGSGTGYLNTMVGLMIGPYGINHGIELHADNVIYARERLESFIQTNPKFDDMELCEPQFVVGNCLNLAPENRLYDRVYCGASCPVEQKETIQNMIKVSGILVIPVGDQLLKIRRVSETEFSSENVLPVSFASLILPVPAQNSDSGDPILLPDVNPLSLQCICRVAIRNAIRDTFDFNVTPVSQSPRKPYHRSRAAQFLGPEGGRYPLNILPTAQGLMIMGAFDQSDEDDDEEEDVDASDDNMFANELQQAKPRTHQEGQEQIAHVDSDVSDLDDTDDQQSSSHLKSIKESSAYRSLYMDREGEASTSRTNGKRTSRKVRDEHKDNSENVIVSERKSGNSKATSTLSLSYSSPYENIKDRILTLMSARKPEISSATSSTSVAHHSFSESEDTSLSLNGHNSVSSDLNTRPLTIEMTSSGNTLSESRAIQDSYSTSADTSETSGFGSLGDDGCHHSDPASLKDDVSDLMSGDSVKESTPFFWPEFPRSGSSVDANSKTHNEHDADNADWMDIEENEDKDNDGVCQVKRNQSAPKENSNKIHLEDNIHKCNQKLDDDDDEEEDSKDSLRGPDFTAFLKAKVDTLPIPSTLKAFLLHYR